MLRFDWKQYMNQANGIWGVFQSYLSLSILFKIMGAGQYFGLSFILCMGNM